MAKLKKQPGARKRLRAFFEEKLGRVVTSDQLRDMAGISEWARRVRELRDEEGLQILTHNDREDLKSNEYLLETLELRPVIARDISDKLRRQILERNGYTCQVCGAGASEDSGCEPGKPDVVMPAHSAVVFVHGCYWHMHTCKRGRSTPATNVAFWRVKRSKNRERDRKTLAKLRRAGWRVLVVWECQTSNRSALSQRLSHFLLR